MKFHLDEKEREVKEGQRIACLLQEQLRGSILTTSVGAGRKLHYFLSMCDFFANRIKQIL